MNAVDRGTVCEDVRSVQYPSVPSPWLTTKEAAARARVGQKVIYREVKARRLKAARIGGRRDLRLLPEWVDQWLERTVLKMVA